MKMEIELQPISTPNYVFQVTPPRSRQEGFVEAPKYHLKEISAEVLSQLCDEFRENIFIKAEKRDPRSEK